jgi:hypothetical protein
MTPTNVALYEALKPSIGEDAARMIAEIFPPASDLATKSDVREAFLSLHGEMREGFATLRGEMQAESKTNLRWIIGLFVPVWVATWGTMIAVLFKL